MALSNRLLPFSERGVLLYTSDLEDRIHTHTLIHTTYRLYNDSVRLRDRTATCTTPATLATPLFCSVRILHTHHRFPDR